MDALVGADVGDVCGLGTHGRTAGGRGFEADMEASEAIGVGDSVNGEGAVMPGGRDAVAESAEPAIAVGATVDATAAETTAAISCVGATPMLATVRCVPGCLPLSTKTKAADATSAATRKKTPVAIRRLRRMPVVCQLATVSAYPTLTFCDASTRTLGPDPAVS